MTFGPEQVAAYIKRVKERAEHVRGNEQATKQSLIGPFFTMLGWDLTDPRECIPEFKADFGKERSTKPIDWAFSHNGNLVFFVEAKEVGKKLAGFDEQLADYFAKDPSVKLGILTNGVHWRFFTDLTASNVMDREPFATWDALSDQPLPLDLLTILTKEKFNPELIRAYAQRLRQKNLLVSELTRLLNPAPDFIKLAIENIETRKQTAGVIESWTPIVANALDEWARQRLLSATLVRTAPETENDNVVDKPRIETTAQELEAFASVQKFLGPERPIAYEDTVSYLKLHLPERNTHVFARLQVDRRNPLVWVPLPNEQVSGLVGSRELSTVHGWTIVTLEAPNEIMDLGPLFEAAYAYVRAAKAAA